MPVCRSFRGQKRMSGRVLGDAGEVATEHRMEYAQQVLRVMTIAAKSAGKAHSWSCWRAEWGLAPTRTLQRLIQCTCSACSVRVSAERNCLCTSWLSYGTWPLQGCTCVPSAALCGVGL